MSEPRHALKRLLKQVLPTAAFPLDVMHIMYQYLATEVVLNARMQLLDAWSLDVLCTLQPVPGQDTLRLASATINTQSALVISVYERRGEVSRMFIACHNALTGALQRWKESFEFVYPSVWHRDVCVLSVWCPAARVLVVTVSNLVVLLSEEFERVDQYKAFVIAWDPRPYTWLAVQQPKAPVIAAAIRDNGGYLRFRVVRSASGVGYAIKSEPRLLPCEALPVHTLGTGARVKTDDGEQASWLCAGACVQKYTDAVCIGVLEYWI